jgi:hypothetical protein
MQLTALHAAADRQAVRRHCWLTLGGQKMGEEKPPQSWWTTIPGILTAVAGVLTAITGLLVALQHAGIIGNQDWTIQEEPKGEIACSLSGLVFDSDSNKPLPGVWVDLYRDLSSIQQRPQVLKAGAATTGPDGRFSINCSWVKESQFPLLLAVRHGEWVATRISGPKIERSGQWDGINIPIPMSEVELEPLRELSVSFSSKKVDSDWLLMGNVENKSGRSFPCIKVRFDMSTSYQDQMQGESKRHLGFLDVEVRDLEPHEKRPYQKKLPQQAGISLDSKQECQ